MNYGVARRFTKFGGALWKATTTVSSLQLPTSLQLHPLHSAGCGSLDHDVYALLIGESPLLRHYGGGNSSAAALGVDSDSDPTDPIIGVGGGVGGNSSNGPASTAHCGLDWTTAPLPLPIGVIDAAVVVYAHVYAHIPTKHRLQMFDHFNECLRMATKNVARQQAVSRAMLQGLWGSN